MKQFLKDNEHHFHFIFRVVIGLLFILHGTMKWGAVSGFQVTNLMFYAGVIEMLGGLFIVIGLFVRTTAVIAALEMTYAFVFVHVFGQNGFNINPLSNNGEAALLFLVSFLVIAATGPTSWSAQKD
jgi:putative oxidoreductase